MERQRGREGERERKRERESVCACAMCEIHVNEFFSQRALCVCVCVCCVISEYECESVVLRACSEDLIRKFWDNSSCQLIHDKNFRKSQPPLQSVWWMFRCFKNCLSWSWAFLLLWKDVFFFFLLHKKCKPQHRLQIGDSRHFVQNQAILSNWMK